MQKHFNKNFFSEFGCERFCIGDFPQQIKVGNLNKPFMWNVKKGNKWKTLKF